MARELGFDSKTIKRNLSGNVELKQYKTSKATDVKLAQYKHELLEGMEILQKVFHRKLLMK